MNARACVTTAKAPAAIAAIRLEGPDAAAILDAIVGARRALPGKPPQALQPGDLKVTEITDGPDTLDRVVIACPETNAFEINCHGNPLIVAAVMRLLQKHSVQIVSAEQMLHDRLRPQCENTIELEARLHQLTAATLPGAKLLAAEARTGLAAAAKRWLANVQSTPLESIQREADEALRRGRIAKPLIQGCKIVLAGPPNSGKSTLLNALTGRLQAIAADIPGTTRDYVTADCRIGPLAVEFLDTAGLDNTLTSDAVDHAAQTAAKELLNNCDLVFHVIDASHPGPVDPVPTEKPTIAIFNKSDLAPQITPKDLPFHPAAVVSISALHHAGLKDLAQAIRTALHIDVLDLNAPTSFTYRQTALLTQLAAAPDKSRAKSFITQLLTAPLPL